MKLFASFKRGLCRVADQDAGQDLVEYALMAAFVATAACAVMSGLASGVGANLSQISSTLSVVATQVLQTAAP